MNKNKEIGNWGEEIAVQFLKSQGYQIIERNFRSSQGEIDIIAQDGIFLVFVEVKNYSFNNLGSPFGALRKSKRESLVHAAQTYLFKKDIKNTYCRFDVLAIYRPRHGEAKIDLLKNAFQVN